MKFVTKKEKKNTRKYQNGKFATKSNSEQKKKEIICVWKINLEKMAEYKKWKIKEFYP